jgi:hypothetical protein
MSLSKLSLGGNKDVITELFLPRGSLICDIPAGDGKLMNLFLRCILYCHARTRFINYIIFNVFYLLPVLIGIGGHGGKGGAGIICIMLCKYNIQYVMQYEGQGILTLASTVA